MLYERHGCILRIFWLYIRTLLLFSFLENRAVADGLH